MSRTIEDRPFGISFEGCKALTKQSFKNECDINHIMKKYERTGIIDHTNNMHPEYGDFASVDDYHSAQNKIREAQTSFDALPVHIRTAMRNDPANLIDFMSNPNNKDEAVKLGLIVQSDPERVEPTTTPSPVSQDTKPEPEAAG